MVAGFKSESPAGFVGIRRLPMVLRRLPLSLPIFCVAAGAGLSTLSITSGVTPHPQQHLHAIERLTELVVLISLMGAGLKLDRLI